MEPSKGATADFYPDVAAAGGLAGAVAIALREIGSSLSADRAGVNFISYARVEAGERFSQIYMAAGERLFLIDFWRKGVQLAEGSIDDLQMVATVIDAWVRRAPSTAELAERFRFVHASAGALAYEEGREVEQKWAAYLALRTETIPGQRELFRAAWAEPRLRQLFPFTSMGVLCFSRCTGYPFVSDTPSIASIGGGRYRVYAADGRGVLGEGNVREAVEMAAAALPSGCGPAVAGTADDFGMAGSGGR
jgi:hypothetical protein